MNRQEYEALCAQINYHMDCYYNQDAPEISDFEYDNLMLALKKAEKEHSEWITPDSPTQKIGGSAKREAGIKVTHNVPMLSIEDVFTKEEVSAWVEKVHQLHPEATFSVETKIDGLSATLRYKGDGSGKMKLVLCETRGDGLIGEDVTLNAEVIPDVKKTLNLPYESLEIRGEVFMSHKAFENFNRLQEEQGKKTAANPRNLAAGTLRQLDPKITRERGLKMSVFNVQSGPEELTRSHTGGLEILKKAGVKTVIAYKAANSGEVIAAIDKIGELRGELEFDIDGAVVKIDETALRADFPAGSKYSSGHIAYKYPPEEKNALMDEILVDVGRTGKLTFTGVFHDPETGRPLRLCGTQVSRATLHNQDYIDTMKIGVGGIYKVFKSGEIIPKLNGCVKEPLSIFKAPEFCPVCGEKLEREPDTADIRCINQTCPAQRSRNLAYFASLDCMNIAGLGETLIDVLCRTGYLKTCDDIYTLNRKRESLIEEGLVGKEKNTDKILEAIEKSKQNEAYRLLAGLGIRNVGKKTAKDIMKHFPSVTALSEANKEELLKIDDIGETTADCIVRYFNKPENREMLLKLVQNGVNDRALEITDAGDRLRGMTIVVTGTLPTLGRNEVTELIEKNGGKCAGSVSKKTTLLVAGEAAGSKLMKANELGIPVTDEAGLLRLIETGNYNE